MTAEPEPVRITGTDDPVEIAAVLALLATRRRPAPVVSPLDRWREQRVQALRRLPWRR